MTNIEQKSDYFIIFLYIFLGFIFGFISNGEKMVEKKVQILNQKPSINNKNFKRR